MNDVARKIQLANDAIGSGGFIGVSYSKYPDGEEEARLHGGKGPTIFRTLKTAYQNTGLYRIDPEKIVLLLDLSLLPVVHRDAAADSLNRASFTDLALAERQMILWTERAERLQKAARA